MKVIAESGHEYLATQMKNEIGNMGGSSWEVYVRTLRDTEGYYNIIVILEDLAGNTTEYTLSGQTLTVTKLAQNALVTSYELLATDGRYTNTNITDFRLYIDNTPPTTISITEDADELWNDGLDGIFADGETPEVGRLNPGYVTKANSVTIKGYAEKNARVEVLINTNEGIKKIALTSVDNTRCEYYGLDQIIESGLGDNKLIYIGNNIYSFGNLVTKYGQYCEFTYTYTFPDNGANLAGGIPLYGYSFSVRVVDPAANTSAISQNLVIYHDTEAPVTPTVVINTPEIISNTDVDVNIKAELKSDVMYYVGAYLNKDTNNSTEFDETPIEGIIYTNTNGVNNFKLTIADNQKDGNNTACITTSKANPTRRVGICNDGIYVIYASSADAAGNNSGVATHYIERDTVAPAKPELQISYDFNYVIGKRYYYLDFNLSGELFARATKSTSAYICGTVKNPNLTNCKGYATYQGFALDVFNESMWNTTLTLCESLTDEAGNVSEIACTEVKTPIRFPLPNECGSIDTVFNNIIYSYYLSNGNLIGIMDHLVANGFKMSMSCALYGQQSYTEGLKEAIKAVLSQKITTAKTCVENGNFKYYQDLVNYCDSYNDLMRDINTRPYAIDMINKISALECYASSLVLYNMWIDLAESECGFIGAFRPTVIVTNIESKEQNVNNLLAGVGIPTSTQRIGDVHIAGSACLKGDSGSCLTRINNSLATDQDKEDIYASSVLVLCGGALMSSSYTYDMSNRQFMLDCYKKYQSLNGDKVNYDRVTLSHRKALENSIGEVIAKHNTTLCVGVNGGWFNVVNGICKVGKMGWEVSTSVNAVIESAATAVFTDKSYGETYKKIQDHFAKEYGIDISADTIKKNVVVLGTFAITTAVTIATAGTLAPVTSAVAGFVAGSMGSIVAGTIAGAVTGAVIGSIVSTTTSYLSNNLLSEVILGEEGISVKAAICGSDSATAGQCAGMIGLSLGVSAALNIPSAYKAASFSGLKTSTFVNKLMLNKMAQNIEDIRTKSIAQNNVKDSGFISGSVSNINKGTVLSKLAVKIDNFKNDIVDTKTYKNLDKLINGHNYRITMKQVAITENYATKSQAFNDLLSRGMDAKIARLVVNNNTLGGLSNLRNQIVSLNINNYDDITSISAKLSKNENVRYLFRDIITSTADMPTITSQVAESTMYYFIDKLIYSIVFNLN